MTLPAKRTAREELGFPEKFDARPAQKSALGGALGTDHEMVAKLVEISQAEDGRAVGLNELAWARYCTEGKVAIAMKYAVEQGYVERTSPRGDQGEWKPTQKGIDTFAGDTVVMPEMPKAEIAGVEVQGVPQSELASWTEVENPDRLLQGSDQRELSPGDADD